MAQGVQLFLFTSTFNVKRSMFDVLPLLRLRGGF